MPYRPDGEHGGGNGHVSRLAKASRLAPAAATARSFDSEIPALDLSARASDGDGPEVYEWPGGYVAPADGRRLTGVRLEELRFGTETFAGHGTSLVPIPGVAFAVEGQPRLLAVGVVHRGSRRGRRRGR